MQQQRRFHDDFSLNQDQPSVASNPDYLTASSGCYFEHAGFSRIALPYALSFGKLTILVLGSHICYFPAPFTGQIRLLLSHSLPG
jgi:hypothetical protein